MNVPDTLAQIRTMPRAAALAALAALPAWMRNLTATRTLAQEIEHGAAPTPEPKTVSAADTPAPAAPRMKRPNPEPTAGTLEIVQWCAAEHIPAELVGRWVWVEFPTKPDAGTLAKMKARGFRWVKTRGRWAHDCGFKSRRGKGDPRDKYGAEEISKAAARMTAA